MLDTTSAPCTQIWRSRQQQAQIHLSTYPRPRSYICIAARTRPTPRVERGSTTPAHIQCRIAHVNPRCIPRSLEAHSRPTTQHAQPRADHSPRRHPCPPPAHPNHRPRRVSIFHSLNPHLHFSYRSSSSRNCLWCHAVPMSSLLLAPCFLLFTFCFLLPALTQPYAYASTARSHVRTYTASVPTPEPLLPTPERIPTHLSSGTALMANRQTDAQTGTQISPRRATTCPVPSLQR
ncbi:hypothetical protein DENSPDRAFT_406594 [Dentipellis sp. KUC8613]|nr:hypothetical protein DENSPDRAFT_406594 [Dentipellis sp. KUC8613]